MPITSGLYELYAEVEELLSWAYTDVADSFEEGGRTVGIYWSGKRLRKDNYNRP
nr:hypothetical protein Iba_chr04fCG1940 [Ipomoea batatas]GMC98746.1 hypothetical protein Iba_chr05dCG19090 [Ipomoea batatas]GMD11467.1 hypothetical protein Iba_chr06fCG4010 [Ipomoea batatas]GMD37591.1 hypothetical protein Iba_chr09eCG10820 [Ipomoea batatas]GMD39080.1 hypothetical protein Iba_chr09fCG10170 [Ipomoea batatas]